MSALEVVKPTIRNIVEANRQGDAEAEAQGCTILVAKPNELLVDLDSVEKHPQFNEGFDLLQKQLGYPQIKAWKSRNRNIHVRLQFEEIAFSIEDQIKWQLILGSDPERERWNGIKAILGMETNRLYVPPDVGIYRNVPIMLWCRACRSISVLTYKEYFKQLSLPNRTWACLNCGEPDCGVIE